MSRVSSVVVLWMLTGAASISFAQNTFPTSGNVGIGTTAPASPLQVVGVGSGVAILGEPSTSSGHELIFGVNNLGNGYGDIQSVYQGVAYTPLLLNPNGGNVGIGTTAPSAKLDIGDLSGNGTLESVLARLGEGNTSGDGTYIGVRGWCTQPNQCSPSGSVLSFSLEHHFYGQTNSSMNFYRGGSSTGGFITFATNDNSERLRIDSGGNVGIGTTSPGFRLDVSGQVHTSGGVVFPDGTTQTTAFNPTICGGDYAESVDVTGDRTHYEPGDLLVLDPEHPGNVLKSSEPYSKLVSGIFSTKPGTVGRRQLTPKSPTEVPMAMVGIVPAKVSTENGPIQVGDLLVSSSRPGYAMKGTDPARTLGAVVGKAMGTIDSGVGVIEVLVTLQ